MPIRTVCNGAFEQQFAFWGGTDNATLVSGRTGQAALVAKDSTNSDIQQLLPGLFEAGHTYRATAWCKVATGNAGRIFLGDSNLAYGPAYEHDERQDLPATGAWQQLSVTVTFTHQEQMQMYLYGGSTIVYDDVQIAKIMPAASPLRTLPASMPDESAPDGTPTSNSVPEPATLGLIGLGIAGIAYLWRRSR